MCRCIYCGAFGGWEKRFYLCSSVSVGWLIGSYTVGGNIIQFTAVWGAAALNSELLKLRRSRYHRFMAHLCLKDKSFCYLPWRTLHEENWPSVALLSPVPMEQLDAGSCLVPLRPWRCDAFPTRDDNSAPTPLTQRDNPGESRPSWPACPVTEERSLHSIKSKIVIIRKKEIWAESHESERRAKFQGFNQDKLTKLTSYWNLTYHWGE